MIPRLWQCEDPAWWALIVGAPTTLTGLLLLTSLWLLLSATQRWGTSARVLRSVCLSLVATIVAIVVIGVLVGQFVSVQLADPSAVYETAKWAIVAAGWPVVFSVAVISLTRQGKPWVGPPIGEAASAKRKGLAVVALLLAPAWLALSYSSIPSVRTLRSWVAWPVDVLGCRFATSECLAEIVLERASASDASLLSVVPQMELLVLRRRSNHREAGSRAFSSYRKKVRWGRLAEPDNLYGVLCSESPEQRRELLAWATDPGQSPATRALAAKAYQRATAKPTVDQACR